MKVLFCGCVSQTLGFTSVSHPLVFYFLLRFPLSAFRCRILFLLLLIGVVGITTIDNGDVVKVEFGLMGIIEGCKVCQDCLHKHRDFGKMNTGAFSFFTAETHHFHSLGLTELYE